MKSSNYSVHLRLLGMAALWGASWPWGRVVAQAMPPLAAASLRFLIASAILLLWMSWSGRLQSLRTLNSREWLGLLNAAAFGVFGYSIFFLLALKLVPAGKASMVVALNPVLILILATLLFREPVNRKMTLGVVMAVLGALYALSGGSISSFLPGQSGIGEWLLLGCALCWVSYTLIGRTVLTTLDSLITTSMTTLLGALLLSITSLTVEGPSAWGSLTQVPASAWYSLFALALGSTALAFAWYLHGVKILGATSAGAYLALVPLFGVLLSSIWLKEALSPSLIGGGLLAISGMALMSWGRQSLSPEKESEQKK
ncbi:DMT family transporter [Alcaligenes nematophilus]